MRHIPGVVLHWPAKSKIDITAKPGRKLVDFFRYLHVNRNGWSDIGYHYIVHRDESGAWTVYDGRPDARIGAHSGTNWGNQHLGVNVAYGVDEEVQIEAVQTTASLIADLAAKYGFGINEKTIRGHRDFLPTECPGDSLYSKIANIVSRARNVSSDGSGISPGKSSGAQPNEEQIGKIKMLLNGVPSEGVRINNQAFLHVSYLTKLGLSVKYDKTSDTVIINSEL